MKKRAVDMDKALTELDTEIQGREKSYADLENTADFKTNYLTYATRETWSGYFDKARTKLTEAKTISSQNLAPLIKKNSKKDIKAVDALLNKINDLKMEASQLTMYPLNRIDIIKNAEKNAAQMREKSVSDMEKQKTLMGVLSPAAEKALSNHPTRQDAIKLRLKPLMEGYANSIASMGIIEKEMKSESPDYAFFADACIAIEKNLRLTEKEQPILYSKLGELDRSYSKTLIDMNAEYFLQIGRVSWEESEYIEYPTETEYAYDPVQVDEETFEYYSNWPDEDNVAKMGSLFGNSLSVKVEQKMWDRLGLDPMVFWPSSDNEAEYFIKNMPSRLFHKYRIMENEKVSETDWIEVDETFFYANEDNLGMDLIVKPFGYFEDEAIKTATPQGMAYVGNQRYGRWRTGSDGLSFWEFYGMYSLLNNVIGMRYYRPDYDMWNRNYRGRKPYYGQENNGERYGSGGVFTRTRYAGSYYSRSGGFRRSEDSVRGAGASSRGRGIGGGGK
ncbi:MAG: hypothetical protein WC799_06905 [Desulfobacteraceae bacterium]